MAALIRGLRRALPAGSVKDICLYSQTSLAESSSPPRCRTSRIAPTLRTIAPAVSTCARYMSNEPSFWTSKTGQTGLPLLGAGVAAYLLSKEILVLHYETVVVASVAGVTYMGIKKAGATVATALDDRAQGIADKLNQSRDAAIKGIENDIKHQQSLADGLTSIDEIFAINKELYDINRELAHRENQIAARNAAIGQLEQFVKAESEERKREQDALVAKLRNDVLASLKGQESAILKKCIADISALAAKTA